MGFAQRWRSSGHGLTCALIGVVVTIHNKRDQRVLQGNILLSLPRKAYARVLVRRPRLLSNLRFGRWNVNFKLGICSSSLDVFCLLEEEGLWPCLSRGIVGGTSRIWSTRTTSTSHLVLVLELCLYSRQQAKHVFCWCWPKSGLSIVTDTVFNFHNQDFIFRIIFCSCCWWFVFRFLCFLYIYLFIPSIIYILIIYCLLILLSGGTFS